MSWIPQPTSRPNSEEPQHTSRGGRHRLRMSSLCQSPHSTTSNAGGSLLQPQYQQHLCQHSPLHTLGYHNSNSAVSQLSSLGPIRASAASTSTIRLSPWLSPTPEASMCASELSAEATATLQRLCVEAVANGAPPDAMEVGAAAREGADVWSVPEGHSRPVLVLLIVLGATEAVRQCLAAETRGLDLAWQDEAAGGRTVFHLLCGDDIHPGTAVDLLQLLLRRLERHPEDRVDWALRDSQGDDFLSFSAKCGRLSLFWPLLRDVGFFAAHRQPEDAVDEEASPPAVRLCPASPRIPFFSDSVAPLPIPSVQAEDWDQLGSLDQRYFRVKGMHSLSASDNVTTQRSSCTPQASISTLPPDPGSSCASMLSPVNGAI